MYDKARVDMIRNQADKQKMWEVMQSWCLQAFWTMTIFSNQFLARGLMYKITTCPLWLLVDHIQPLLIDFNLVICYHNTFSITYPIFTNALILRALVDQNWIPASAVST